MIEPYDKNECGICVHWYPSTMQHLEGEGFCRANYPDTSPVFKTRYSQCDCGKFKEIK